jgi:adenylosuccinate synthase
MSNEMGTTLVFGGQVGSEGKGAIVGYLARRHEWAAAICTFMTNAGHTWLGDDGEKVVVQQLPVALVNPEIPLLLIAPGSAITPGQLASEINTLDSKYDISRRLKIHPRAMIIEEEDAEYEMKATRYLASTAKGCGRALGRKTMRSQSVRLARDITWLKPFLADTTQIANDLINVGEALLIEGSQGFDLDINHGIEYPYCTSRGTTPMQTLADCGISERALSEVIAVLRTYPIRVGNIVENGQRVGYSGSFGGKELSWEEVTRRSGSPVPLTEVTTVTKRTRRVFEIDNERLKYMVNVCRPTQLALTFADYIDYRLFNATGYERGSEEEIKLGNFVRDIWDAVALDTPLIKTGPADSAMIENYLP